MNDITNNANAAAERSQRSWPFLVGLAGIWFLVVVVVNPIGNFPLNDDWAFARSVEALLQRHTLEISDWGAPTLITQVLYGAAFCAPWGISYTALRISTLVAGLFGVLGVYALLREVEVSRFRCFVAALVLMFCPIYFVNAFTFMTDVPFVALGVWAATFFVKALKSGDGRAVVVATCFSVAATLIRQLGIAIPLGYTAAVILTSKPSKRTIAGAVAPAFVSIAVLWGYNETLEWFGVASAAQGAKENEMAARLKQDGVGGSVLRALQAVFSVSLYIGLFTLPYTATLLPARLRSPLSRRTLIAAAATGALLLASYLAVCDYQNRTMPFLGNNLTKNGIGPVFTINSKQWERETEIRFPYFNEAMTLAAGLGTLALVAVLLSGVREIRHAGFSENMFYVRAALFALLTAGVYLGPVSLIFVFDRYVLLCIPLALLLIGACGRMACHSSWSPAWWTPVIALIPLGGLACLAVAGTHDYLEWNRVRWEIVQDLINNKSVPPKQIEGGFEVSGHFLYETDQALRTRWDRRNQFVDASNKDPDGLWWYCNPNAAFIVACETTQKSELLDNTEMVARYPVRSWLWARECAIVVWQVQK